MSAVEAHPRALYRAMVRSRLPSSRVVISPSTHARGLGCTRCLPNYTEWTTRCDKRFTYRTTRWIYRTAAASDARARKSTGNFNAVLRSRRSAFLMTFCSVPYTIISLFHRLARSRIGFPCPTGIRRALSWYVPFSWLLPKYRSHPIARGSLARGDGRTPECAGAESDDRPIRSMVDELSLAEEIGDSSGDRHSILRF